jgi:hypothetical protein
MIATSQMFTACAQARPADPYAARPRMTGGAVRQVLTPDQLVTTINHLLAARPECEGLRVEGTLVPSSRREPDGCNWQPHGLRLRVEHGPSTRALAGVRQVVELARVRYDLAGST